MGGFGELPQVSRRLIQSAAPLQFAEAELERHNRTHTEVGATPAMSSRLRTAVVGIKAQSCPVCSGTGRRSAQLNVDFFFGDQGVKNHRPRLSLDEIEQQRPQRISRSTGPSG